MTALAPLHRRLARIDTLLETIRQCETELDGLLAVSPRPSVPPSIIPPPPETSPMPSAQLLLRSMAEKKDAASLAKALAEKIRDGRKAKGWRQQDLADATGIARPNIARIESGRRIPKISTLHRIAQALEMSLETMTP